MTPTFSILIPVYNAQDYLGQCLDSLLSQKGNDYEILLLDDGSQDGSLAVCDQYSKTHTMIHVESQENAGPLISRKRLLEKASGKYCIFSDADDYWEKDFLAGIRAVLRKYPDCDLICFGSYRVWPERIKQEALLYEHGKVFTADQKEELYKLALVNAGLFSACGKVFRKELVWQEAYEHYRKIRYGEDRIQVMQMLLRAQKIVYLPERLYYYRAVEGSLTQSVTVKRFENMYAYTGALNRFMKEAGIDTKENREIAYTGLMNDFMDSLLKLNTSGKTKKEKKRELDAIRQLPYYKVLQTESDRKRLPIYHKIRYAILQHGFYFGLIGMDQFLFQIKKIFGKKALFRKSK